MPVSTCAIRTMTTKASLDELSGVVTTWYSNSPRIIDKNTSPGQYTMWPKSITCPACIRKIKEEL